MKRVLKSLLACYGIMLMSAASFAQANIIAAEYFFDTDPGFGNGTTVGAITPAINIAALAFNANVAPLSNGMHTLFVRTKNVNGTWSITNKLNVAKVQAVGGNSNLISNINKAEYFYDTDPGFGNGTNIPITAATTISSLVFNADVSTLATGIHTLYLRVKDGTGWSNTNRIIFAKAQLLSGNPNTVSTITKLEYFYDTDPGFGNGIDVPITAAANINGFVFNANVNALPSGMHTMYIRSKDAQGKWSETQQYYFAKAQSLSGNPNTIANIVKAEYFYNTDPGFGNGTDIPLTAANDINGFVVNANVASLPTGLHTFYIRTKDAQGKWSIASRFQFSRIQGLSPNPNMLSKIYKAEYFYDTDPGYGNGTNIPVAASYNVSMLTFNADVTALTNGVHTLYARTRDSLGKWSETNKYTFAKVQAIAANPNTISNIVKAEYFYDNDPGYGAATDIPVVAGSNISAMSFNVDVSSLTNGVHTLYLRTKDAQGKWSVVNRTMFAKVQAVASNNNSITNISRVEYFVDIDPGFGNANAVLFTSGTDVANISFNVDMTVFANGPHTLYVRTKDNVGKWSITNVFPFNGGTAPLSVKLLSFDAKLQTDNTVQLEWVTAQEKDVDFYKIERSYNASEWTFVGQQKPVATGNIGEQKYNLLDAQPGKGIIYYRLTEIDLNGNTTTAPIRFVRLDDGRLTASSVYPNPNDGKHINISSTLFSEGKTTISIISIDGKLHYREEVNDANATVVTIVAPDLAAGHYFINLQGKEKTESLKLEVVTNLP